MNTLLADAETGQRLTITTKALASQAVAEMEGPICAVTPDGKVLVWSDFHEGTAIADLRERARVLSLLGLR